jgi:hypothetical protein
VLQRQDAKGRLVGVEKRGRIVGKGRVEMGFLEEGGGGGGGKEILIGKEVTRQRACDSWHSNGACF